MEDGDKLKNKKMNIIFIFIIFLKNKLFRGHNYERYILSMQKKHLSKMFYFNIVRNKKLIDLN